MQHRLRAPEVYAGVKPIKEYKESIRDTWRAGLPFEEASAGDGGPGRGRRGGGGSAIGRGRAAGRGSGRNAPASVVTVALAHALMRAGRS